MPFRPLRLGGILATEGFKASDFDVGRLLRAFEVSSTGRIGSGETPGFRSPYNSFLYFPGTCLGEERSPVRIRRRTEQVELSRIRCQAN